MPAAHRYAACVLLLAFHQHGNSALHYAAKSGNAELIQTLLQAGAWPFFVVCIRTNTLERISVAPVQR